MEETVRVPRLIRFGAFEVDLRAGELRKDGAKLKLTGQPFQVLTILLEQPGEVVTREELQKRLWPDTFVDVDHNLNTAINKLREVLGDSAENPRFVETLPRRGYRFMAAINGIEQTAAEEGKPARGLGARIRLAGLAVLAVVAVAALLVGVNVYDWRDRLLGRNPKPAIQSLAVLPLANLSGDPEQEYFADGMTEALITELGKVSHPRVISRQSIMRYKGSKKSLQEIAKELNVDAVLEGAVERSGDRVRVTVHLSEANPERQLWAKEYHRDVRDVLGLQDEIAGAVAAGVKVKLAPDDRADRTSRHPVDPQAQDDYLHGQYFSYRNTEGGTEIAIAYYNKAIARDPGYAPPHAELAEAYISLANPWVPGHSPKETLHLARAAASRALQLDPSLTQAHVALGWTLLQDWNWQEAEREARLAVRLNPSDAQAHSLYSTYLSVVGQHDEAISEMKYAMQSDPLNLDYQHELGWTFYRARQYNHALSQFGSLGDNPGLGTVYMAQKRYREVIAVMEKDISQSGRRPVNLSQLAQAYGYAGSPDKARKLLNELNEISRRAYLSPVIFVALYLGLGEQNRALDWIERSYEDRDEWTIFYKTAPAFDPLRSEPRFQAVLRRMNFPQ